MNMQRIGDYTAGEIADAIRGGGNQEMARSLLRSGGSLSKNEKYALGAMSAVAVLIYAAERLIRNQSNQKPSPEN